MSILKIRTGQDLVVGDIFILDGSVWAVNEIAGDDIIITEIDYAPGLNVTTELKLSKVSSVN